MKTPYKSPILRHAMLLSLCQVVLMLFTLKAQKPSHKVLEYIRESEIQLDRMLDRGISLS